VHPEVADLRGYLVTATRRLLAGAVVWGLGLAAVATVVACGATATEPPDPPDEPEPVFTATPSPSASPTASRPGESTSTHPEPAAIVWETDLGAARARAAREQRVMLVFVRAAWSVPCQQMDRTVWQDARVRRAVRSVIALELDVTAATAADDELVARLGADGVPAVVLLDPTGEPIARVVGGTEADVVLALLSRALER